MNGGDAFYLLVQKSFFILLSGFAPQSNVEFGLHTFVLSSEIFFIFIFFDRETPGRAKRALRDEACRVSI